MNISNAWKPVNNGTPIDSFVFAKNIESDRIYLGKFTTERFEGNSVSDDAVIMCNKNKFVWRFIPPACNESPQFMINKHNCSSNIIVWHDVNIIQPPNKTAVLIIYTSSIKYPGTPKINIVRSCYYDYIHGFHTDHFFKKSEYYEIVTHWAHMPELPSVE